MKEDLPFVLLRSNDICFLGILRSCAAAGIRTICVTFTWDGAKPWYSEESTHISEIHTIPNPFEFPRESGEAMRSLGESLLARHGNRLLLLGSSDTNLMFLRDNSEILRKYFRFMGDRACDLGQFELLDKAICAERLRVAKVASPLTFAVSESRDIELAVQEMSYPCIYKPAVKDYGQTFYAIHGGAKAIAVENSESLREHLKRELAAGFRLVVQEEIEFRNAQDEIPFYLYADKNGKITMAATAIKEKLQPHPFGTATILRLSYHPELLEKAQGVVDALQYRGILMIEFIRDQKDGIWKVIEVNPRPWLFVDFFRRFGLNYLQCLRDDIAGHSKSETPIVPTLTSDNSPVHLNLTSACGEYFESLSRSPNSDDMVVWLQSVAGYRSLTYLDPMDREPGIAEIRDFAAHYQIDPDQLLAAVDRNISHV